MDQRQAQHAVAQLLLEQIERDRYPSATQMNILEQNLPPELVDDYFDVLLDKVRQDRWPSLDMLKRVQHVAAALPARS